MEEIIRARDVNLEDLDIYKHNVGAINESIKHAISYGKKSLSIKTSILNKQLPLIQILVSDLEDKGYFVTEASTVPSSRFLGSIWRISIKWD